MSTVTSTTLLGIAAIVAATFAVCFHVIDGTTWEWAMGIAGGGVAGVHLSPLTNAKTGLEYGKAASGAGPGQ